MKNALLAFVAGSIFSFVLGGHTQDATPSPGPLNLTVHDAAGRTFEVAAVYNTFEFSGSGIAIDYESDQFLCSGFGSAE